MKKILLSISVLTSIILFTGCSKSTPSPSNIANVMFVNGCAGNTGVNASANSTTVSAAANLAYLKNTSYQPVTAGSGVNIAFISPGLGTAIKDSSLSLTINTNYSVYLGGIENAAAFYWTQDDLTTPSAGNVKIRLVNLSTDILSLRAQAGNTVFASGVTSLSASSFATIPATTSAVTISAGDSTNFNTIKDAAALQLNSGKIYTVIYTGTSAGSGSLAVTVINNN